MANIRAASSEKPSNDTRQPVDIKQREIPVVTTKEKKEKITVPTRDFSPLLKGHL